MNLPRCPQCRCAPMYYIEKWTGHTLTFDSDENGMPDEIGYTGEGRPISVSAVCGDCGHKWTLKGIQQITEVRAKAKGKDGAK